MLEILVLTLIFAITALGSLLSIFGLKTTIAKFKQRLNTTFGAITDFCKDIGENTACGELLTLLLLLF